jgi:hypothetical protein
MTDKETIMYQILGRICQTDAPIVFKGALVTKLILSEHGYTTLERQTRDIDANWIGTPPPMTELENTINRSLDALNGRFRAEAFREYGDKKSAGLYIVENATGEKIVTMDIDIRPIFGSRVYHYGEVEIRGVLPTEILADKITVLSGIKMFRRSKDFIDVYALTHCVRVLTAEIFEVISGKHLELGEFTELLTRREDVEHAYEKLQGIDGKPPFNEVYPYMIKFVRPFTQRDTTPRIWNSGGRAWDDVRVTEKRPSVRDQLRAAEQDAQEHPASTPQKARHKDEPER